MSPSITASAQWNDLVLARDGKALQFLAAAGRQSLADVAELHADLVPSILCDW